MNNGYDHKAIEKKWQDKWQEDGVYKASEDTTKPKKYILDMFPYPSGVGLHVGHPKGYIATDIISRFYRMSGFNVLHPMGWDAFGLPAEQFAIKNQIHPKTAVDQNVETFKRQLSIIGLDYDWSRELNTTDPSYYKWTQWAFLQMFKKGLAFESHEPINWCPSCKTGLANEDLEDGRCERCGSEIEQKPLRQWVLRITDYAERMLSDLDKLDKWPESVKISQRNWIGKSEGAEIPFKLNTGEFVEVFTTRPDTLFGVTYLVLAPEHNLIHALEDKIENISEVKAYIQETRKKSPLERQQNKEKTGVELKGVTAINPANGEEIPVWISDYVLATYGTGAVMAVPAHDERDNEFAKKFDLEIRKVIELNVANLHGKSSKYRKHPPTHSPGYNLMLEYDFYPGHGALVNSGEFTGFESEEVGKKIVERVGGEFKTTYKLQDWVFSRQRYWGEPIPIVHVDGKAYPLAEEQLPIELPQVEKYEPSDTGESPLADILEWVNVRGSINDAGEFVVSEHGELEGRRETNTMPQWAGSCWYYLRYIDPNNNNTLVPKDLEQYWQPVDVYVGGMEHATRHLIYARFWHKFLFDIGVVHTEEPFMELHAPGLILAEDGRKMSKRWGNVVNPDEMVDRFGADAFRLYESFMGPFDDSIAWNTDGVVGTRRFVERVWKLAQVDWPLETNFISGPSTIKLLNETIKKVGEDIKQFKFNTAVSQMMVLSRQLDGALDITKKDFMNFLKIFAPFAPHLAEELWQELGGEGSIHTSAWPEFDESKLVSSEVTIVVQVNGKVRAKVQVATGATEDDVKNLAIQDENVQKFVEGEPKKIIYVQDKLLNIVV